MNDNTPRVERIVDIVLAARPPAREVARKLPNTDNAIAPIRNLILAVGQELASRRASATASIVSVRDEPGSRNEVFAFTSNSGVRTELRVRLTTGRLEAPLLILSGLDEETLEELKQFDAGEPGTYRTDHVAAIIDAMDGFILRRLLAH